MRAPSEKKLSYAKLDQLAGQALNTTPRTSSLTGASLATIFNNHISVLEPADRRRQCRYSYYCLNCSYK